MKVSDICKQKNISMEYLSTYLGLNKGACSNWKARYDGEIPAKYHRKIKELLETNLENIKSPIIEKEKIQFKQVKIEQKKDDFTYKLFILETDNLKLIESILGGNL